MGLTYQELDAAPFGSQVEDSDGDVWTKENDETWSARNNNDMYHGWNSTKLVDRYTVRPLTTLPQPEPEPEPEPEIVVEGVWIVWSSITKESINGVFPADAEVHALRMVNRDGFGYAQFQSFGEVTY